MKVSASLLYRSRACFKQRKLFKETFPQWGGVEVTRENLEYAAAQGISIYWFNNLLAYGTNERDRYHEWYRAHPLPNGDDLNEAYRNWQRASYPYHGEEYETYNRVMGEYTEANTQHSIGCILYALGIEDTKEEE